MTRTMSTRVALLLGVALLATSTLHSSDLPDRASLAELHAIGQIIVTMSAGSPESENALRQVIERRLDGAGIAIDPKESTKLVANVEVTRATSPTGQKYVSYLILLSFREPVSTERVPRTTFLGTTWSGSTAVRRFGADVPLQTVLDALDNKMSVFLTAVAKDAAGTKERPTGQQ